jgi:glycosyltransferase involved in cell wall biosynthesis
MFFDRAGRHYYFSKHLIEAGYSPTVFCADIDHYHAGHIDIGKSTYKEGVADGIPFVFIKTSKYKGNGFSRIKNILLFARNLMRVAKKYKKTNKPDVILASSHHPLTCAAGILVAKRLKIPCIVEIKDLYPETIVAFKNVSKKNPVIWAMYRLEKWIYKKADKIIFSMEGAPEYLRDKGWHKSINMNKVFHINMGVSLEDFDRQIQEGFMEDSDLENDSTFKVAYTGTVRLVNGLDFLLDVFKFIMKENPAIQFLVWGDGNYKERLEKRIADEGITNVVFKGRVHKKHIAYILSKCDLSIIHIKDIPLYKYGVSPNKLFDYFASGKPIISTLKTGYDLLTGYNAGIATESQDVQTVADAILKIAQMPCEQLKQMGENARKVAREYDYKVLTNKLIDILEEALN